MDKQVSTLSSVFLDPFLYGKIISLNFKIITVKVLKIRTTEKFAVVTLKLEQDAFAEE